MYSVIARASALAALLSMAMPVASTEMADTIYRGGKILTMEDQQPVAEAVAVRDGRIVAVGSWDELRELQGSTTKLFDLNGVLGILPPNIAKVAGGRASRGL